jgi:hypothetical protein
MRRAELLGHHCHETDCGVRVQVWIRGDRYLARGRYQGQQFGQSLGAEREAAVSLRHLLVQIENGTFERPSETRQRPLKTGRVPRLNIRQLCDRYLAETRRLRGKHTARNYQSRLAPLIEFAERPEILRRWPLAMDADREFAVQLRTALHARTVTRNGHSSSTETLVSPRQVFNVLDCARSLFNWARRPDVNELPASLANPFTTDIVGHKAKKDPLRPIPIPLEHRRALVPWMDHWQLCHFAIALVLPLRPEDYTGLLISEVDFQQRLLKFGTRLGGRDFNKARQSFVVPFPAELEPLLRACVCGRTEGPLLRRRSVWEGISRPKLLVGSTDELVAQFDRALVSAPAGEVQAAQDTKRLFRRLLRDLGGVSPDGLAKEFKGLWERSGMAGPVRFYDLRASCNSEMDRSHVSHLVQRYVTGHATSDILYEYVSLDPLGGEMQKYFDFVQPLLNAIRDHSQALGLDHKAASGGS